jgi:hypothetical protein
VAMEMTAVCLGKLAKTASFPHSHSLGDDLEFHFSPSSFKFNFNEKCYLHARYLLLPTCPFAQGLPTTASAAEVRFSTPTGQSHHFPGLRSSRRLQRRTSGAKALVRPNEMWHG